MIKTQLLVTDQNKGNVSILCCLYFLCRIEELRLPREQYEWYMDLRRHGTVEHSGFSLGFDLMVLFTTGLPDVRDVIPFPRSRGKANN
jgi:asparaginyl-tRNA synthetase